MRVETEDDLSPQDLVTGRGEVVRVRVRRSPGEGHQE